MISNLSVAQAKRRAKSVAVACRSDSDLQSGSLARRNKGKTTLA